MADRPSRYLEDFDRAERTVPGDKPIIVADTGVLTYGELFDRVRRLSTLFAMAGLAPGTRVALISRRPEAFTTLFFALLRHGLTVVIVDPEAPAAELLPLLRHAEVGGVVLDNDLGRDLDVNALLGPNGFVLETAEPRPARGVLGRLLGRADGGDTTYPGLLARLAPAERLPEPVADSAPAYMMFTSGTTSRPKAVVIGHGGLHVNMASMIRLYGYDAGTRVLYQLPFHHTDGLTQGPTMALVAGATVYRPGPFSVPKLPVVLDWLRRHEITHFYTVPTVLALIDRLAEAHADVFPRPPFRFVISSAGYLDPGLWRRFEDRFRVPVMNLYGQTEAVTCSLAAGPDDATRRVGTIGRPVDTECRVVDDAWGDVPRGTVGELLLRGEQIMLGYFRDTEATAEALRDGWFATGDLVREEEDGLFALVGRKKLLIIRGGINIHPEEVNTALRAHPDVDDAATFGEADEVWGERVISCVVAAPGRGPTPQALTAYCRERLRPEVLPNVIHVLPDFPRGPAGKPRIEALRRLVADGSAAADGPEADVFAKVVTLASTTFKQPADGLTRESSPETTRGWDSFAHMEFVTALEEAFAIKLSAKNIMSMESLGRVEGIVRGKLDRP